MAKNGKIYKGGTLIYPTTVSSEVYDNETGHTVKQDLTEIGAKIDSLDETVNGTQTENVLLTDTFDATSSNYPHWTSIESVSVGESTTIRITLNAAASRVRVYTYSNNDTNSRLRTLYDVSQTFASGDVIEIEFEREEGELYLATHSASYGISAILQVIESVRSGGLANTVSSLSSTVSSMSEDVANLDNDVNGYTETEAVVEETFDASSTGYVHCTSIINVTVGLSSTVRITLNAAVDRVRIFTYSGDTRLRTLYDVSQTFAAGDVIEFAFVREDGETYIGTHGSSYGLSCTLQVYEAVHTKGLSDKVGSLDFLTETSSETVDYTDYSISNPSGNSFNLTSLDRFVVGQTYLLSVIPKANAPTRLRIQTRDSSNNVIQTLYSSSATANQNILVYWTRQSSEVRMIVDNNGAAIECDVTITHTKTVYSQSIKSNVDNLVAQRGWAHISFDDVCFCLYDITANEDSYDSLFDNTFFAFLRTLHNTYGAKFSLFVFLADSTTGDNATGWTLAGTTTKFKTEFAENSDWLKFGLHSANKSSNYSSATAATASADYASFVSSILDITGTLESIDRLPRFGNFAGSSAAMEAFRDADMGIVGALAAYDTRDSYHLSSDESGIVYKHGQMYDTTLHLQMFTSLTTLEVSDPQTVYAAKYVASTNGRFHNLEWMMHEYAINGQDYGYSSYNATLMQTRLTAACEIAKNHGYTFGFPMFAAMK